MSEFLMVLLCLGVGVGVVAGGLWLLEHNRESGWMRREW